MCARSARKQRAGHARSWTRGGAVDPLVCGAQMGLLLSRTGHDDDVFDGRQLRHHLQNNRNQVKVDQENLILGMISNPHLRGK